MRLIDADKLVDARFMGCRDECGCLLVPLADVRKAIRLAPTVNAVPSEWHDAKTDPPKENGEYLCITIYNGCKSRPFYHVYDYAKNLESVDDYDFHGDARPGWYDYDSEWGYCEIESVAYWMPLPELPKGE